MTHPPGFLPPPDPEPGAAPRHPVGGRRRAVESVASPPVRPGALLRLTLRGPGGAVDVAVPDSLCLVEVLAERPDLAGLVGLDEATLAAAPRARLAARLADGTPVPVAVPLADGLAASAGPAVPDGALLLLGLEEPGTPADDPAARVAQVVGGDRSLGPGLPAPVLTASVLRAPVLTAWLLVAGAGLAPGVLASAALPTTAAALGALSLLLLVRPTRARSAPTAALVGTGSAALAGLAALPAADRLGVHGPAAPAIAGLVALLVAGTAAGLLGRRWGLCLPGLVAGAGLAAGAGVVLVGGTPAAGASVVLTLTVMASNLAPWWAAALVAETDGADPGDGPGRGTRPAHDLLLGSAVASVPVTAACAAVLSVTSGPAASVLPVLAALLVGLRARHARGPLRMTGLVVAAGAAAACVLAPALFGRSSTTAAAVLLAAALVLVVARPPGGTAALRLARWGDAVESLLLVLLLPTAVLAAGLGPDLSRLLGESGWWPW
ncbi:hypothetical protein [Nocardioides bruguierae]|uniref:hypothetical protein n=1 Tax=Nocardioides bruguierae TaxID=2945102 RepID=UPI0020220993|nr:hypothetical protein [Nocardioides bruguierae]MCL8025523.1 hypothetical protein [Nocardioides bruguierae]MCL8027410.1 hypothetical protein [Nocardioides bruguierae]